MARQGGNLEVVTDTSITNDSHLAAMFSNADSMILHARTAANVSKHKDLN